MKISESKILSSIMCGCYCYLHLYKGCTTFYFETATHGHYFIQLWLRDDPITWDVRVKCEKEYCEYIFNPHTSTQVLLVTRAMRWSLLNLISTYHFVFRLQHQFEPLRVCSVQRPSANPCWTRSVRQNLILYLVHWNVGGFCYIA